MSGGGGGKSSDESNMVAVEGGCSRAGFAFTGGGTFRGWAAGCLTDMRTLKLKKKTLLKALQSNQ